MRKITERGEKTTDKERKKPTDKERKTTTY